jgi:hypothetical protein
MRRLHLGIRFGLLVVLATGSAGLAVDNPKSPPLWIARITLRQIDQIKLATTIKADNAEAARISQLIGDLAAIDKPDFGISATLGGDAFAPIPGVHNESALLLTDHQLQTSNEFTELVKLGPKALPYLLAALENPTPSKLVMKHEGFLGSMWFDHELRGNPGNAAEQAVLGQLPAESPSTPHDTQGSYTVKVGDICFVIIGQIVGRSYSAVRYQPSANIIVNSPVHDPALADAVRKIWSSDDPAQHLLDSLLLDFASEGVFNGRSLDGWGVGSTLQCQAALRLLFYFPKETATLIATRLGKLNVQGFGPGSIRRSPDQMHVLLEREVANGVRTADLVRAAAWSEEPPVRAALRTIFATTTDTEILRSSLAAVFASQPDTVRDRLQDFLGKLPEMENGPFGDGYHLLIELGARFGSAARPVFERYLDHASAQRIRTMSRVLRTTHGEWSVALLAASLDDRRPANGETYALNPGQNEPRRPIRLCDEAAETIATNFPALTFKMAGEPEVLDQQIAAMRDRIARNDF